MVNSLGFAGHIRSLSHNLLRVFKSLKIQNSFLACGLKHSAGRLSCMRSVLTSVLE